MRIPKLKNVYKNNNCGLNSCNLLLIHLKMPFYILETVIPRLEVYLVCQITKEHFNFKGS